MGNTDSFPLLSQTKSAVQGLCGDSKGAWDTQINFSKGCLIVSQVRSAIEYIKGDSKAAKETQLYCFGCVSNFVNGIPVIGHIKGGIHYAFGDNEGGNEAMKSSSRTVGVIGGGVCGFFLGGPPVAALGGVAGGQTLDVITSVIDSAVHGELRPNGSWAAVGQAIKNPNSGNVFDCVVAITSDALTGYFSGKRIANKITAIRAVKKEANNPDLVNAYKRATSGQLKPKLRKEIRKMKFGPCDVHVLTEGERRGQISVSTDKLGRLIYDVKGIDNNNTLKLSFKEYLPKHEYKKPGLGYKKIIFKDTYKQVIVQSTIDEIDIKVDSETFIAIIRSTIQSSVTDIGIGQVINFTYQNIKQLYSLILLLSRSMISS
ncbi:3860_t:CDS:1 [Ambispora gerdemannii]|uniref:3860_t:CDS:1 n=1 Tax=Ambispora gerdemannii TaxID=144530 RepID=A0A9N9B103_9GLOM|nr:3860_t:CDS:1 [Ambispora gerdemannii]